MIITTPDEFEFKEILHFLGRSPKELLHQLEADRVIKLLKIEGQPILIRLSASGKNIKAETLSGKNTWLIQSAVKQYVIDWFDLDKDLKPFYAMAKKDKYLKSLVRKYFGYRIVGQPDLFESLVWAVLGQQINLSFAYTLKQQFVKGFGERLSFKDREYFLFPSAEQVAQLSAKDLLNIQFSRQKAAYTIGIAKAFSSGEISKEMINGLPLEEAKKILIKIKGIGNWTANYALMKTFRYPDAFPLEDAGLKNAVRTSLKLDRAPTLAEIEKVFEAYKGWEAYATLYLWRSL